MKLRSLLFWLLVVLAGCAVWFCYVALLARMTG